MTGLYKQLLGAFAVFVLGFCVAWCWQNSRMNTLKDSYEQAVNEALQKNREVEQKLQADADAITVKYQKEQKNAQKTINSLRSRIADGSLRLSIPTEGAAGVSTDSSSEYREGRTYIDRRTAERLITITDRGDKAIRRLNECVDRYESLMNGR